MKHRISYIAVFAFMFSSFALAQSREPINFSLGGGLTIPAENVADRLNSGWNVNFRGGSSITPQLLVDLDYTYIDSRLNDASLARLGEPNGGVGIWSLTLNPILKLAPSSSKVKTYVTAGYGLYHLNFKVTRPAKVRTRFCEPLFGFCSPAEVGVNQVVASNGTYKGGFNAGLGFDFLLGQRKVKLFTEARYHRMFRTSGSDVSYIPVTFGLRW